MSDILRPSLISLGAMPVFLPLEVRGLVMTWLSTRGFRLDFGDSSSQSSFFVTWEGPGTPIHLLALSQASGAMCEALGRM